MSKRKVIAAVLLSRTPRMLPQVATASFKCKDCGTNQQVNASLKEPYCHSCGGDLQKTATAGVAEKLNKLDDTNLVHIACTNTDCGAHLYTSTATALTLAGAIHCPACSTAVSYSTAGIECDEDEAFGGELEGLDEELDDLPQGENTDDIEEASDDDLDSLDDELSDESGDDDSGYPKYNLDDSAEDLSSDDDYSDDEGEQYSKSCGAGDMGMSDVDGQILAEDDESEDGVDINDAIEDEEEEANVIRVGDAIAMLRGVTTVASLRRNNKNADFFDRDAYINSINTSIKAKGVTATIAAFGFAPLKIRVSAKALQAKLINREVTKVKASLEKGRSDYHNVMRQSLQIAMAKLNRNMTDKTNSLKGELFEALSALGIRGGEKVIELAFTRAGDEYATEVLAEALSLASKPNEVRDEIAKVVAASEPIEPELDDDLDADEELEESQFEVTSSTRRLSRGVR